jgi:4-hydroxybenzoate polyprenyltransferase
MPPSLYVPRMGTLRGYVTAAHAAPTAVVTLVMTVFAWSIGWRGAPLALVAAAVLVGQLSVGWSNDAFDAALDREAGRREKPTVAGAVAPRGLWVAAWIALLVSCLLSWVAAGPIGGSFHVFFLAMAWLYNVALSRTAWSWLPYALAFGAMPAFLYVGLDGSAPPWWTVAVFAIVATSAHLANALPDLESDRETGLGGLAVRLGRRRSTLLCWGLLALGTGILVAVTWASSPWTSVVLVGGFAAALVLGSVRPAQMFPALLAVVVLDVVALIASPAL